MDSTTFKSSNENARFNTPAPIQVKAVSDAKIPSPVDSPTYGKFAEMAKDTPPELAPVITLLTGHQNREYAKGFFMILSDLTADGKPVADRKWVEVYGKLVGTVLSIIEAEKLDIPGAKPTYINITDSTFKSMSSLPSPGGDLDNIIVLSTTMKNRFLLQFNDDHVFHTWTAALRLSIFESISLQEAYTGALLSAKGAKLNGIRMLLSESKFAHEDWVRVRFGTGMPWTRCWAVVTPMTVKAKKKQPPPGTICFFEDDKKVKKSRPLATVVDASAAFAVYPERAVLVNGSTLIKIDGRATFADLAEEKESSIFVMPDKHPGVEGFETLIRFLIPTLDVFQLYGRPQRLNADKGDMRSLLFGMPTLPCCNYLEVNDVIMLVTLAGSDKWSGREWSKNLKELLARKIATGYKGSGDIRNVQSQESLRRHSSNADSMINRRPSSTSSSDTSSSMLPNVPSEISMNSGSSFGASTSSSPALNGRSLMQDDRTPSPSNNNLPPPGAMGGTPPYRPMSPGSMRPPNMNAMGRRVPSPGPGGPQGMGPQGMGPQGMRPPPNVMGQGPPRSASPLRNGPPPNGPQGPAGMYPAPMNMRPMGGPQGPRPPYQQGPGPNGNGPPRPPQGPGPQGPRNEFDFSPHPNGSPGPARRAAPPPPVNVVPRDAAYRPPQQSPVAYHNGPMSPVSPRPKQVTRRPVSGEINNTESGFGAPAPKAADMGPATPTFNMFDPRNNTS